VFDGHCDSIAEMTDGTRDLSHESAEGHLDLPRLRRGGVGAQVMAIWTHERHLPSGAMHRAVNMLGDILALTDGPDSPAVLALTPACVVRAIASGRPALVAALEGAEPLEGSLEALHVFHRAGIRLITLTWSRRNQAADGVAESGTGGGLTRFGRELVAEMGRLGVVTDISHISEKGFWETVDAAAAPVVASHSNAKALCAHPRNLTDDQIRAVAASGGLVGVCLHTSFLDDAPETRATVSRVADHVLHIGDVVGLEHVGLGSDFDGGISLPAPMRDVRDIPLLLRELSDRGLSPSELVAFAHGNWMRVFGACCVA
jgi:membrane dipeptidase